MSLTVLTRPLEVRDVFCLIWAFGAAVLLHGYIRLKVASKAQPIDMLPRTLPILL